MNGEEDGKKLSCLVPTCVPVRTGWPKGLVSSTEDMGAELLAWDSVAKQALICLCAVK